MFEMRLGLGRGGTEIVACNAGDDDEQDCGAVEENCLEPGARLSGLGGIDVVCVSRLRVHGRSGREHGSIEVVEVITVRGFGAGAVDGGVDVCGGVVGGESSLQLAASTTIGDERGAFGGVAILNMVGLVVGFGIAEGEAAVVEALSEKHNVCQCVVNRKNDLVDVSFAGSHILI